MSVRIICGDRIQSVTAAVLSDVRNSSVRWPEQQGMILVPEYRKLTVERQYLEQDDAALFMMTEVLSFNRLAMRLLSALGLSAGSAMNPQLRAMVLRRVMYENRAALQHYGSLRYNSAFLREMDQLIGEMRRFGIDAGRLSGLAPIDETQRRKFHDLAILLAAYEAFLEAHNLYDRDHWQQQLAGHLHRLAAAKRALGGRLDDLPTGVPAPPEWLDAADGVPALNAASVRLLRALGDTAVWVTGYGEGHALTPLETDILDGLIQLCRSVTLTAVADETAGDRGTGPALMAWVQNRCSDVRVIRLAPAAEPPGRPDVDADADVHVAVPDGPRAGASAPDVILWSPETAEAELRMAAGEAARLVKKEGFRYRDLAVVINDPVWSSDLIRRTFEDAGVPVFMRMDSDLLTQPLPRLLLGAFGVLLSGWERDSVIRYLRNPFVTEDLTAVDLLETHWLRCGLSGWRLKKSVNAAAVPAGASESDPALQIWVHETQTALLSPLCGLEADCADARCCDDFCLAVLRYFEYLTLEKRIEALSDELTGRGDSDRATQLVLIWNTVLTMLSDIRRICGQVEMDAAEFQRMFKAGLDHLKIDMIPTTLDQVLVGNPEFVLGNPAAVLMILSADQEHFPGGAVGEPLMHKADRLYLSEMLGVVLPDHFEAKAEWDRFSVEQLMRLPERWLYLSCQQSRRGAARYREAAEQMQPVRIPRIPVDPTDPRLYDPQAARRLLMTVRRHPDRLNIADLADWQVLIERTRSADPAAFVRALSETPIDRLGLTRPVRLDPALVRGVLGTDVRMSASQLEGYAGCPYAHFARYMLGTRDRDMGSPDSRSLGSLMHAVMKRAVDVMDRDPDFYETVRNLQDPEASAGVRRWVEDEVDQLIASDAAFAVFGQPAIRQGAVREACKRTANAMMGCALNWPNPLISGRWPDGARRVRMETEWAFGGPDDAPAPELLIDGVRVRFNGVIDRVDIGVPADAEESDSRCGYAVYDYKTTGRRPDLARIDSGLDYQLALYMLAWQHAHPGDRPVRAGYIGFDACSESVRARIRDAETLEKQVRNAYQAETADFDDVVAAKLDLQSGGWEALAARSEQRAVEQLRQLLSGVFDAAPRSTSAALLTADHRGIPDGLRKRIPCTYCAAKGLCRLEAHERQTLWLRPDHRDQGGAQVEEQSECQREAQKEVRS